jgi:8-oxo-dGTP pyrophosphatase MutT (NUDIX family)
MIQEMFDRYNKYFHFFVGKLAIFRNEGGRWHVLVTKRHGEKEYDNTFSFPGGRKEVADTEIIDNLRREKAEELGSDFKINIFPDVATTLAFTRKDGIPVVGAVFPALYDRGEVRLGRGYSEYRWVDVEKISTVQPYTPNLEEETRTALTLLDLCQRGVIKARQTLL